MRTVHKYQLTEPVTRILLPQGAKPLYVAMQRGIPCLWIEVDTDQYLTESRVFEAFGTGHQIPNNGTETYVGSFMSDNEGTFVFHVYEVK